VRPQPLHASVDSFGQLRAPRCFLKRRAQEKGFWHVLHATASVVGSIFFLPSIVLYVVRLLLAKFVVCSGDKCGDCEIDRLHEGSSFRSCESPLVGVYELGVEKWCWVSGRVENNKDCDCELWAEASSTD
jgi:hypothetical protein